MPEGPFGAPRPFVKEREIIPIIVKQPITDSERQSEIFDKFVNITDDLLASDNLDGVTVEDIETVGRLPSYVDYGYVGPECSITTEGMRQATAECYIGLIPNATRGIRPIHFSRISDSFEDELAREFRMTDATPVEIIPASSIPGDIDIPYVGVEEEGIF